MSVEMTYQEMLDEVLTSERLTDRDRKRALVLHVNMRQNVSLGLHQMDWLDATLKKVRKPVLCHYLERDGECMFKGRNRYFKDRSDTKCNLRENPQRCEFYRERKGGMTDEDGD